MTWKSYNVLAVIVVIVVLGLGAYLINAGPKPAGAITGEQNKSEDHVMPVKDDGEDVPPHVKCGFPEWIGKPVDRQAVKEAAGDRPFRIYGVNDMVTMDYRPKRLNVIVDTDGIVKKVECG